MFFLLDDGMYWLLPCGWSPAWWKPKNLEFQGKTIGFDCACSKGQDSSIQNYVKHELGVEFWNWHFLRFVYNVLFLHSFNLSIFQQMSSCPSTNISMKFETKLFEILKQYHDKKNTWYFLEIESKLILFRQLAKITFAVERNLFVWMSIWIVVRVYIVNSVGEADFAQLCACCRRLRCCCRRRRRRCLLHVFLSSFT